MVCGYLLHLIIAIKNHWKMYTILDPFECSKQHAIKTYVWNGDGCRCKFLSLSLSWLFLTMRPEPRAWGQETIHHVEADTIGPDASSSSNCEVFYLKPVDAHILLFGFGTKVHLANSASLLQVNMKLYSSMMLILELEALQSLLEVFALNIYILIRLTHIFVRIFLLHYSLADFCHVINKASNITHFSCELVTVLMEALKCVMYNTNVSLKVRTL